MQDFTADSGFQSSFFEAADGLKLHVRVYGDQQPRCPVICLPGLTRNSADFHALALRLSLDKDRPRQVFALDLRGRGLSAYDPQPLKYAVPVEVGDVMAMLTRFAIGKAAFVGTSRGGIVTMGLAMAMPDAIAAVVLNDVGPIIDLAWLQRAVAFSPFIPYEQPNWAAAIAYVKRSNEAFFPRLNEAEWERFAQQLFREQDGRLVLAYDPAISLALAGVKLDTPFPPLWPQFDALARKPVMLLRGEHSDLLTREVALEMKARHSGSFTLHEVAGEGHAPLINDDPTLLAVRDWLALID